MSEYADVKHKVTKIKKLREVLDQIIETKGSFPSFCWKSSSMFKLSKIQAWSVKGVWENIGLIDQNRWQICLREGFKILALISE